MNRVQARDTHPHGCGEGRRVSVRVWSGKIGRLHSRPSMVAHVNARLGSLCKWRKQRLAGLDLTAKTGLACRILGSFSATLSLLIINLPPTHPNRPATHPPTHPPTRHLAALPGSPLSTPGGGREGGDRDGTGREEEEGENSGGNGGRGRRRQR